MPQNAEGQPVENIDKITLRLNPQLHFFIDWEKIHLPLNSFLQLEYKKPPMGMGWLYLTIHGQRLNNSIDIRTVITVALKELIERKILIFPVEMPEIFLRAKLDWFVSEVKEIEFAFDFALNQVTITDQNFFISCGSTLYSRDRRVRERRPARDSALKLYIRDSYLKKQNKIKHILIDANPYKMRIEFRLTKENCPYRTLKNIDGSYLEVIKRYAPYLAVLYCNKGFLHKIIVSNFREHPFFSIIYNSSKLGRTRYTGPLEKYIPHKDDINEKSFYCYLHNAKAYKSGNINDYFAAKLINELISKGIFNNSSFSQELTPEEYAELGFY